MINNIMLMDDNDIEKKIEAILFFKGEPITIKKLAEILGQSREDIAEGIAHLKKNLSGRGIVLVAKEDTVTLGTAAQYSGLIESLIKEELHKDLGKAGLETLSVVLYLSPVTRSRIDYIRGVNSTFILRNLMVRGLVEKILNPADQRSFLYKPTMQLLSYLGITDIRELPGYDKVRFDIENFEKESHVEEEDAPVGEKGTQI